MDTLNKITATSTYYLPTKKVGALEIHKLHKITQIKKVKTKKFGTKIVLELDGAFDIFLPAAISKLLVKEGPAYK